VRHGQAATATTALESDALARGGAPPRFLLATGRAGVRIFALPPEGEATLGRGSGCDVVLKDDSISRRHARLRIGEPCTIADLGSRNGTLFRGRRLRRDEEHALEYGDSFSLGPISLQLLPPGTDLREPVGASRLLIDDPDGAEASPLVAAVAQGRLNIVIYGETGVGKELLAATLHRASRRGGPFLGVNCAALSESLLENELFGHERGAYTGAVQAAPGLLKAASGGTVFLDEIGEMTLTVQAKLLRAIETQSILPVGGTRPVAVDVRFLAATHRDLLAQVASGQFRRDLYYRLAGFAVEIPPLRQRKPQIMRLAMHFLAAAATRSGVPLPSITPAGAAALEEHDWPGNVRELRNVMERALVLASDRGAIEPAHLMFDTGRSAAPEPVTSSGDDRSRLIAALDACAGNQTRAAALLGISRTKLVQQIALHRIPRPRKRL